MTNAQSKHGGAKVGFPPPFVFLGLILSGVALQHWLGPLPVPLASPLHLVVGAAVALSGVALVLSARLWFFRTRQHPAPWRPSPELLMKGIYRRTRNPMYLGITTFQLGLGIATANLWMALLAPLALLIVHYLAVLPEEAYLSEKFGDSYQRYSATVPRYLWL
jgi:protein-S-isoprenylcysteine O-methyltransferase Ste14